MKWKFWSLFACVLFSSFVFASDTKNTKATVILNQVTMIKEGEVFGDNLYFDIAVFGVNQPAYYYRAPKFPFSLPSSKLGAVKSVKLWSKDITSGEKFSLILSLVDQDLSALNPDDVIGSVRLQLKNEKGSLKAQWSIPNQEQAAIPVVLGKIQTFKLSGTHGHYEVSLTVKQD